MLKSVAWTVGFRVLDRAAGVISMLLLARLLLPEHFGIVALATSVLAFVELLGALGLDTILIQKKDPTREHFDTAWTIQLGIASICGLILAALVLLLFRLRRAIGGPPAPVPAERDTPPQQVLPQRAHQRSRSVPRPTPP